MRTVLQHIQSLPQPYLNEALQARDPKYDDIMTSGICAALMLALPEGTIRDTILKAWNRGEFAAKHVGQAEARVDMVMPIMHGDPSLLVDENDDTLTDYTYTDSDKFTEQYASNGDSRTINHEAY